MHSDEGVYDAGVKLQVTCFFHADFQPKLLLVRLIKLFLELQHHRDVLEDLGGSLCPFATVQGQGEPVTHRVL